MLVGASIADGPQDVVEHRISMGLLNEFLVLEDRFHDAPFKRGRG
jgi:hypothetical protein